MDFVVIAIALVINVIFSAVVAYVASEKGRSAGAFFALSFFLSFIVGMLVVIALPPLDQPRIGPNRVSFVSKQRLCEHCAEEIKWEALVCKHCGRDVQPMASPDSEEALADHETKNWCNKCYETVIGEPFAKCPKCGKETYPWDGIN